MGYFSDKEYSYYGEEIIVKDPYRFGEYYYETRGNDYVEEGDEVRNLTEEEIDALGGEGYFLPESEKTKFRLSNGTVVNYKLARDAVPTTKLYAGPGQYMKFDGEIMKWVKEMLCIKSDRLGYAMLKPYEKVEDMRKLKAFLCAVDSRVREGEASLENGVSETTRRRAAERIFGKDTTPNDIKATIERSPLKESSLFKLEPEQIYDFTTKYLDNARVNVGNSTFSNVDPLEMVPTRSLS